MKAEDGPRGINEGGTRTRDFRSNTSRSCVSCLYTGDITVPSYDVMSEDQGRVFFIYIYFAKGRRTCCYSLKVKTPKFCNQFYKSNSISNSGFMYSLKGRITNSSARQGWFVIYLPTHPRKATTKRHNSSFYTMMSEDQGRFLFVCFFAKGELAQILQWSGNDIKIFYSITNWWTNENIDPTFTKSFDITVNVCSHLGKNWKSTKQLAD